MIKYRGCIAINVDHSRIKDLFYDVPIKHIDFKNQRDGENNYHLTVINPNESIGELDLNKQYNFDILGLGNNEGCYYLVCVSAELDNLRLEMGLESKDFHITLGFDLVDKHNIPKDISTIKKFQPNFTTLITKNLSNNVDKNIKILTQVYHLGYNDFDIIKALINELSKKSQYIQAIDYARLLLDLYSDNIQSYYMFLMLSKKIDSFDEQTYKLIYSNLIKIENISEEMVFYAKQTTKIINKIGIDYGWLKSFILVDYHLELKKIVQYKFDASNFEILNKIDFSKANNINMYLNKINEYIIQSHDNPNKTIFIYSKDNEFNYVLTELPCNFSKVNVNLYGSGIVSARHINSLKNLEINTIINLIGEEKPKEEVKKLCEEKNIKLYHYGFPDRTACDFKTFLEIQEIINNPNNICLVHCMGGIGRTNMVLCGNLIKELNMSPSECIADLKKSRKVIMVPEQILFLKKYYGYITNLDKTQNNLPLPSILKGLVLFVGLPCSGKSTLSMEIYTKYSNLINDIIHLNQDEIGKSACEELLSSKAKSADLIILDRCNPSDTDRINWIRMYKGLTNKKVTIIYLNLGLDLSLKRLPERKNHLTLGAEGSKIIIDMSKKIVMPNKKEGWDELIEIKTLEELDQFKKSIGLIDTNIDTEKIIKFPRTKHLMNLGAMTRDDLLMDKTDIDLMLKGEITVEEKIDGANLGFRLGSDNKIMAQNRSHYVYSTSHPQFKKLDQWIESHKADLMEILYGHNYIIYGEWLYSKHSINYTKLPDYFIMFDLYDIDTKTFFSRNYVEELIKNTNIKLVPLIYKGKTTQDKLKALVQSNSQFYEGPIEGVYIRSFDANKLKFRAKIVRSDFISGDEHWTKGKIIINSLTS